MGRAPAVLIRQAATPRVAAVAVLAVALGAYYAGHERVVDLSKWWDIAFLAVCLIPAVFALVYLVLPLWRAKGLFLLALALLALTVVLEAAELNEFSSFSKLALTTTLGFWFLGYFESVLWVAFVAVIIPWVDAVSVWRGPTGHIVEEEPGFFDRVAFAFPHPGEPGAAQLGPPDMLFFALFLAAAARWNLRVGWTWVALTLSLGATMVIGATWESAGLPALPGLAFGFLIPNADLLWAAVLRWRRLRRLSPRDMEVVRECLLAAVDGPFFPDAEFHALLGLRRSDVRRVARYWPDGSAPVEQDLAVTSVLANFLSYPHGQWDVWSEYVSAPLEEVASIHARWGGTRKIPPALTTHLDQVQ